MARFPATKDEKFLLGVAEQSLKAENSFFGWVDWKELSKELNLGEKSCHNIVNILARTALVEKKEPKVRLTKVAMRHYGTALCEVCKVDESFITPPEDDSEEDEDY